MNFQFSPEPDKNKIFLVKRSELEGRLDPIFYSADLNRFIFGKYKNIKIGSLAKRFISGVGAGKQDQAIEDNGIIQIRPTNIDANGTLKYDKNIFLPSESKFVKIQIGDVLFNNTNSQELVGKTAILKEDKELFFSNHITKITVDKSKISPDYLAILLNIYQRNKIFYSICTNWNNQSGVGLNLLKSLKIPVPPKEIQTQIVAKMDDTYTAKKQKEAQAQRLLDSIDDYLLGQLGIELPKQEENTIQSRMFTRRLSEVSGGRFDPYPYQKRFLQLDSALIKGKIPIKKLKEVVTFLDYGLMPTQDYAFSIDDGLPMIRVTNIIADGSIDMTDTKFIKFDTPKLYKKLVKTNDILMVQCGNTTGKCALVSQEYEGYTFGSFSFVIRSNEKIVLQNYLFNVLSSFVIQEQLNRSMTITSVRPNTSKPEVLNFKIPIPPIEKQTEIADHISKIRNQAKALQQQAKEALEQAKKEVETMVLGADAKNA